MLLLVPHFPLQWDLELASCPSKGPLAKPTWWVLVWTETGVAWPSCPFHLPVIAPKSLHAALTSIPISVQRHEGQLMATQLLGLLPGLASAMKYLSEMGYVHRGLAARRMLLGGGLVCKISGFGRGPRDRAEAVYTTMVRFLFHRASPHPIRLLSLPCQVTPSLPTLGPE